MKKWILLIGLLTYSSSGWSEELVMECTVERFNLFKGEMEKESFGIFKMDSNQPSNTKELLTFRVKGKWKTLCEKYQCEKGDRSVFISNDETEMTLDFRFKSISILKKPKEGEEKIEWDGKCEMIE